MTITRPDARSAAPGQGVVDAALLLLERMGLIPDVAISRLYAVASSSAPVRRARISPMVRSRLSGSGSGRWAWIW